MQRERERCRLKSKEEREGARGTNLDVAQAKGVVHVLCGHLLPL
jgi:hypothetical protein